MAGGEGFEPSPTGPEPAVLPLDDPPTYAFILYHLVPAGSRTFTRKIPGHGLSGQFIAILVLLVPGMAPYFDPPDIVDLGQGVQLLPKIPILHRGLFYREPTVFCPAFQPFLVKGIDQVGAVRVKTDPARVLQGLQTFDGRRQFHPLVGGMRFGAGKLPAVPTVEQDSSPAAGAGVTAAGAIGIDLHLFFLHPTPPFPPFAGIFPRGLLQGSFTGSSLLVPFFPRAD